MANAHHVTQFTKSKHWKEFKTLIPTRTTHPLAPPALMQQLAPGRRDDVTRSLSQTLHWNLDKQEPPLKRHFLIHSLQLCLSYWTYSDILIALFILPQHLTVPSSITAGHFGRFFSTISGDQAGSSNVSWWPRAYSMIESECGFYNRVRRKCLLPWSHARLQMYKLLFSEYHRVR